MARLRIPVQFQEFLLPSPHASFAKQHRLFYEELFPVLNSIKSTKKEKRKTASQEAVVPYVKKRNPVAQIRLYTPVRYASRITRKKTQRRRVINSSRNKGGRVYRGGADGRVLRVAVCDA
eukprot:1428081-Rhodomonas_salina.1